MSRPLTIADKLEAAADLLEQPDAWTQGQYARDAQGSPVQDGRNPAAVCWCAIGALEKVCGHLIGKALIDPLQRVMAKKPSQYGEFGYVAEWNDAAGRTQAEVVAKFREAAALVRSGAA